MKKTLEYPQKFEQFKYNKLYTSLKPERQKYIRELSFHYRFTFQEFRQVVESCRDLEMWGEVNLEEWWESSPKTGNGKRDFLSALHEYMGKLKTELKVYDKNNGFTLQKREKNKTITEQSDKNIFGWCPVASEKTVCCNLRTIDAVESCAYGCSYCTIQTFYNDKIVFDADLKNKLRQIKLDPDRYYHIGTGQSSDALIWGNREGLLDSLFKFADDNPNVLLELKTKSDNVRYFLENDAPPNIVCSWSLNPQEVIDHEEYYTASLEKRLNAARKVADRGVKVAFHFHPIIYYRDWIDAYTKIAEEVQLRFSPREVLFISFGSVTFIKPVIKKIRQLGLPTKILQMKFVTDPHGKMTYPDDIKIEKFRTMNKAFKPWHDKVFFYLCMEKASIWLETFGYVYNTNEEFEQALLDNAMRKIVRQ